MQVQPMLYKKEKVLFVNFKIEKVTDENSKAYSIKDQLHNCF